jgi:hypothetical protein
MRTVTLAMGAVFVAAATYLVGVTVALLAVIFGVFAIMAASGGRYMPHPGRETEFLLLLLPALATGAIVVQVRRFFRPLLSGAVGTGIAVGAVCVLIAGASNLIGDASNWELIVYPAAAGLLAIIGGIVRTRVCRRPLSGTHPAKILLECRLLFGSSIA